MIFNKGDDLRGCTVRLRYMKPGESLTIPMDAERYRCISHVGYWWDDGSGFQNTNDCAWLGRYDIVEVLHRPGETQKPAPTFDDVLAQIDELELVEAPRFRRQLSKREAWTEFRDAVAKLHSMLEGFPK